MDLILNELYDLGHEVLDHAADVPKLRGIAATLRHEHPESAALVLLDALIQQKADRLKRR
jgi:hypothetical protein